MPISKFWKELLKPWKIVDDFNEIQIVKGLQDDKGVPAKGFCDTDNKIILLDQPMVETESLDGIRTILHEANHQAIETTLGEEVKNDKEAERLADFASLVNLQLMVDNTEKFKVIIQMIERRKRWAAKKVVAKKKKPRSKRKSRKKRQ
jgi:hypothetical protein